ncbi:hypothetical protein K7X08_010719 [Anisodus acutangulus]|uniref:Uncharacterized protein n=1 Tax=Anisodus acutangulus TaxID=402998 RepID=A0A9Q1M121_9SOLA|nr:hypothetical protein K7X08_010719 [Anisodus acutangulus]
MPITRGPAAFSSTSSLKSNQQKSCSSNLSVNNENGTSLNDNFLGKSEDSDRENIMIQVEDSANQELLSEPQEFGPACDSLVPAFSFPDAPTILSQLPQERMPAKDATQFISSAPGQQREWIARQIEMTDEISQLEKQYLGRERLNRNTEKDVILSVEDSSSYNSINVSEPIQMNMPNNYWNLSLTFQPSHIAGEIVLRAESTVNFLAGFEKTKSLLETSAKDEEDRKDKYTQLESKEKELMAQVEAIQKKKNEIAEQRCENFNQTKHLASLAEEQAGRTKEKELQMTITSTKLDKLKNQWVSVQSSFN